MIKQDTVVKLEPEFQVELQALLLFEQQRYTTKPTGKGTYHLQDCSSLTRCEFIVAYRSKELIDSVVISHTDIDLPHFFSIQGTDVMKSQLACS